MITLKPNFFKIEVSTHWVAYGLLQRMKGIRCLEVVSNPSFLEHTFFLKVKSDHRSKFCNLSNWKEEA